MLPGKRSKKVSFWEGSGSPVCGKDTWDERSQVSNGTGMKGMKEN